VTDRAFPVFYARDVASMARFYEWLGFAIVYQFPPDDDDPGYVTMQRGDSSLGITTVASPELLIGVTVGTAPRFEMFVYVEGVDTTVRDLRAAGLSVLKQPQDMPWGERLAYVADPKGNPVALATQ
jgi:lactoylglutathione lyase